MADLNGDGLDDLVIRDLALGQLLVFTARSLGIGGSSFDPGRPWMTFAATTNPTAWNDPGNGDTLRMVRFGKKRMITAGATTGIVYSGADPGGFNPGWRHLCNTCYTTLLEWNADRRADSIAWADLDGSGSDWWCLPDRAASRSRRVGSCKINFMPNRRDLFKLAAFQATMAAAAGSKIANGTVDKNQAKVTH